MRDIGRIVKVCGKIAEEWEKTCPDWRFLQLMSNFIYWLGSDGFYFEDEEFLKRFEKFMESLRGEL